MWHCKNREQSALYFFVRSTPQLYLHSLQTSLCQREASLFFASERDSFSLWRLGRLVYGRLLFAMQIFVLAVRLCLKRDFRHIAHQSRQSLIATTSLRFALGCCRRSSCVIRLLKIKWRILRNYIYIPSKPPFVKGRLCCFLRLKVPCSGSSPILGTNDYHSLGGEIIYNDILWQFSAGKFIYLQRNFKWITTIYKI